MIKQTFWYILYTFPRAEKIVKKRLDAEDVECYLPLHKSPRVWSDRVKIVDIPLFRSYIFVRCDTTVLFNLLKIPGIIRIVLYNNRPATVRQKEIDAIKEFLELAKNKVLCTGDDVEILTGSMKNISGKIVKIKKKCIYLHIRELAATVCVDIQNVAHTDRIK